MPECPVCCDAYTAQVRAEVRCAYCGHVACMRCYKQYLLGSAEDVHCMSCRRAWPRDVYVPLFPRAFLLGEYKTHRERVLVEREKALLPETQPLVRNFHRAQRLREALSARRAELKALQRRTRDLQTVQQFDLRELRVLTVNGYREVAASASTPATPATRSNAVVGPCPAEGCRGFLTKSGGALRCGTCSMLACKTCGVATPQQQQQQGEDHDHDHDHDHQQHQCAPDAVESFREIQESTRPCPKCAARIFRISGCDQM
jgi:hypothetical protein